MSLREDSVPVDGNYSERSQGSFTYQPLIVVPPIFPHYENSPIPKLLAPIPMTERLLPIIPVTVALVIVAAVVIVPLTIGIVSGVARILRGKTKNEQKRPGFYGYQNYSKKYKSTAYPVRLYKKDEYADRQRKHISRQLSIRPSSLLDFSDTGTESLMESFNLNDGPFDL
ncbi:hypothetical protein QYM36_002060 [Artemia franciscana]|uniref:Uncharacterized protein n=1 Tax=Artemia franciscana TaxID=6661 RepID=A0AA88LEK5_ARTSF|nr:hypothetical protein QYM36_002060 [Artemia franciscana]